MYSVKANLSRVRILYDNTVVYSLDVDSEITMKITAETLVKFVNAGPLGLKVLKSLPSPKGLWFEDVVFTNKILNAGLLLFGTDYEKFVVMAKKNPALLLARKTFDLQLSFR